jgi:hypothetical protein
MSCYLFYVRMCDCLSNLIRELHAFCLKEKRGRLHVPIKMKQLQMWERQRGTFFIASRNVQLCKAT